MKMNFSGSGKTSVFMFLPGKLIALVKFLQSLFLYDSECEVLVVCQVLQLVTNIICNTNLLI